MLAWVEGRKYGDNYSIKDVIRLVKTFRKSSRKQAAPNKCMRARLTPEKRSAILEIKEAYWRRPEYRDTITSDLIYCAVLANDVRTVGDFDRFLAERPA